VNCGNRLAGNDRYRRRRPNKPQPSTHNHNRLNREIISYMDRKAFKVKLYELNIQGMAVGYHSTAYLKYFSSKDFRCNYSICLLVATFYISFLATTSPETCPNRASYLLSPAQQILGHLFSPPLSKVLRGDGRQSMVGLFRRSYRRLIYLSLAPGRCLLAMP